ncbi:hypothetical protein F4824DRAFT_7872 [Ustulina deusta]|nr:hypothetical protein F4824DRAFT_7872 [Ustulina deusta]
MACNTDTLIAGSPPTTEQDQVNAIMASLPPIEPQDPTSAHDAKANAYNAAILAVRGLHTTATGYELSVLANIALCNNEIAATPTHTSFHHTASVRAGAPVSSDSETPVTTFEPFYFFFYGSLQLRGVLQGVCNIPDSTENEGNDAIVLREGASIQGWKIKMWGPYPALVPAAPDEGKRVDGMAWLCEKPEHVARLCRYETGAYRMAYCDVSVPAADGHGVEVLANARTFVSTIDADELDEGKFSLAKYQRRMKRF